MPGKGMMMYGAALLLLVPSFVMMMVAVCMPDWSHNDLGRVGLWEGCSRISTNLDWVCLAMPEALSSNGYILTARVTAVWGTVTLFIACLLACAAMAMKKRILGVALLAFIVMTFILLCIAWGTWIGAHNDFFGDSKLGLRLGSSFIMTVVASAFVMLCICLAAAGMTMSKKEANAKGADVEAPPAYMDDHMDDHKDDLHKFDAGDIAPASTPNPTPAEGRSMEETTGTLRYPPPNSQYY